METNMNIQNFISYQRNVKCLSETTLEYYKNILIRYKECDFNYQKFANENFTDNRNSNITYINVIKSFLIFWKEYKKIEKISIPKREYKVQEWIKFDEYEKLLNFYSKKSKHYKANIRRILVLRVLFECGIRNNEIRGVSVNDIKDDGLLINGKGKKQRLIYINNELRTLFFEYINK
jgi:site-specific recombinase XerD